MVALSDPLVAFLRSHKASQAAERLRAGSLWQDDGWLFIDELGRPINPRTDWSHWKAVLQAAGVGDARLHDARHTAATCLLLLGVTPSNDGADGLDRPVDDAALPAHGRAAARMWPSGLAGCSGTKEHPSVG